MMIVMLVSLSLSLSLLCIDSCHYYCYYYYYYYCVKNTHTPVSFSFDDCLLFPNRPAISRVFLRFLGPVWCRLQTVIYCYDALAQCMFHKTYAIQMLVQGISVAGKQPLPLLSDRAHSLAAPLTRLLNSAATAENCGLTPHSPFAVQVRLPPASPPVFSCLRQTTCPIPANTHTHKQLLLRNRDA